MIVFLRDGVEGPRILPLHLMILLRAALHTQTIVAVRVETSQLNLQFIAVLAMLHFHIFTVAVVLEVGFGAIFSEHRHIGHDELERT